MYISLSAMTKVLQSHISTFQVFEKHNYIINRSACKIASRTSTPCDETELTIEGIRTRAIKITLYPKDNMIGTVDCVGILKMRNADVENKYKQQLNKNMTRKKNNSIVRMAFRATIPELSGDESFRKRKFFWKFRELIIDFRHRSIINNNSVLSARGSI